MSTSLGGVYIAAVLLSIVALWLAVEVWLTHREGEPK